MATATNPLELQQAIIAAVLKHQADGIVTDAWLADALAIDRGTLWAHLEMLAAEQRIELERTEDGYELHVTPAQQTAHEAPSATELLQQQLDAMHARLDRIRGGFCRAMWWAPIVLPLAIGGLAFAFSDPANRVLNAVCGAVFGAMIGVFAKREFRRE